MKYVVCCICSKENLYIEEWCKHYLSLGFDTIILCDNNHDNERLNDISYIRDNDKIIVEENHNSHKYQMPFYKHVYSDYDFEWLACFDCDEFLFFNDGIKNIDEFVKRFPSDCKQILCQWKMYTYNKQIHYVNKPVVERFTEICADGIHIKSIVKKDNNIVPIMRNPHIFCNFNDCTYKSSKNKATDFSSHVGAVQYIQDYSECVLNHYYTKSIEEFITKINRGSADSDINRRSINDFWNSNIKNEENERILNNYIKENQV